MGQSIGVSVAVSAATYWLTVFILPEALVWVRFGLPVAAFIGGLAVAFWLARVRVERGPQAARHANIGTDIRAKRNAIIKDVDVEAEPQRDIHVGTRVSAGGSVEVSNVRVRLGDEPRSNGPT